MRRPRHCQNAHSAGQIRIVSGPALKRNWSRYSVRPSGVADTAIVCCHRVMTLIAPFSAPPESISIRTPSPRRGNERSMICSPIGILPNAHADTGWMPGAQTSGKPFFSRDWNVRSGRPTARNTDGLRRAHQAASAAQSITNLRRIRTPSVCTVSDVTDGFDQSQYQIRFDWGLEGAKAIGADADVIVLVDVLGDPARLAESLECADSIVVAGSLRNSAALARWALERQADKGDRFTVAIIAAGETRASGTLRFALEDLLGAGAIIDALAAVGIDYCSPEAAAASAAYIGLRNATGHLIGASTSGRSAIARGDRAAVDLAIAVNSSDAVPVLREFSLRP